MHTLRKEVEQTDQQIDCNELRLRVGRYELLLREANHRIANSLQLALGLIGGEAVDVRDSVARSRLIATQRHIEAVAGVHRLLSVNYAAETLPLHDYLSHLVAGIQASVANDCGDRIISFRGEAFQVAPEVALSLGMIVNELVSNACKYAYAAGKHGEVRVTFTSVGAGFSLVVENDGNGLDVEPRPPGAGLGTRIVSALAQRLDAEFHYEARGTGTRGVVVGPGRALRLRQRDFPSRQVPEE